MKVVLSLGLVVVLVWLMHELYPFVCSSDGRDGSVLVVDGSHVSIMGVDGARRELKTNKNARVSVHASDNKMLEDALEADSYGLGHTSGTLYTGFASVIDEKDGSAVVDLVWGATEHEDFHSRYRVKDDVISPIRAYRTGNFVDIVVLGIAVVLAFIIVHLVDHLRKRL